jgi:hypothetical protein
MRGGYRPRYDAFALPLAASADPASPVNYVARFLGRRLGVLVMDQRLFVGIFVRLDGDGWLWLTGAVQYAGEHRRTVGNVAIPVALIQALDLREP